MELSANRPKRYTRLRKQLHHCSINILPVAKEPIAGAMKLRLASVYFRHFKIWKKRGRLKLRLLFQDQRFVRSCHFVVKSFPIPRQYGFLRALTRQLATIRVVSTNRSSATQ